MAVFRDSCEGRVGVIGGIQMRIAAAVFVAALCWSDASLAAPVTLVTVGRDAGMAVFVDRASITTDGNLRTAWFFTVIDPADPTDGYDIIKAQESFDCARNTIQLRYLTAYSPTDKILSSSPLDSAAKPIRSGSIDAAKRDFLCKGKFDPKLNFEVDTSAMRTTLRGLVVGE